MCLLFQDRSQPSVKKDSKLPKKAAKRSFEQAKVSCGVSLTHLLNCSCPVPHHTTPHHTTPHHTTPHHTTPHHTTPHHTTPPHPTPPHPKHSFEQAKVSCGVFSHISLTLHVQYRTAPPHTTPPHTTPPHTTPHHTTPHHTTPHHPKRSFEQAKVSCGVFSHTFP